MSRRICGEIDTAGAAGVYMSQKHTGARNKRMTKRGKRIERMNGLGTKEEERKQPMQKQQQQQQQITHPQKDEHQLQSELRAQVV